MKLECMGGPRDGDLVEVDADAGSLEETARTGVLPTAMSLVNARGGRDVYNVAWYAKSKREDARGQVVLAWGGER